MKQFSVLVALLLLWSCSNMDYDLSKGIDREVTLFSDQISLPLGDVGPLTPRMLIDKVGMGDMLKSVIQEDEEGYLVVTQKGSFYSNPVLLCSYLLPDPTRPSVVQIDSYSGSMESTSSLLEMFGLSMSPQVFTLQATNPLTEEIAVSGKLAISSDGGSDTLLSQEFSEVKVSALTTDGEFLKVERTGGKMFNGFKLDDMRLHLPASITEKDPLSGWSSFSLAYNFKAYLSLVGGLPGSIPFDISDLDLPLGQYKVKEARICADAVSEIPITLDISDVEVLVKRIGENGVAGLVPCEDVSVDTRLTIASGCTGSPVVTPLEIVVKANEGTIPDISGLRIGISVKAPSGEGDKRLNLDQTVSFKNLRATVSGGITIPSL